MEKLIKFKFYVVIILFNLSLQVNSQESSNKEEIDSLIVLGRTDLDVNPETHGDYVIFLKYMSMQKDKDPKKFIDDSKNAILLRVPSASQRNATGIFNISSDYNEAALAMVIACDEGFPPLVTTVEDFKKQGKLIEPKCKTDDEREFLKEFTEMALNETRIICARIGLPSDLDNELKKIDLGTDEEVLRKTEGLSFSNTIGRGKWPKVRTEYKRHEKWQTIEADPEAYMKASRIIILERVGMKGDSNCESVFSNPYLNMETLHAISIVGNGFSLSEEEKSNFKQQCKLAMARTKSVEEHFCLIGVYGLVLKGDRLAKANGN